MGLINYKDNTIGRIIKKNEPFFKGVHNKQNYFLSLYDPNEKPPEPGDTYLTFTADTPFQIRPIFTQPTSVLEYSLDHESWIRIMSGEETPISKTIYMRGVANVYYLGYYTYDTYHENNAITQHPWVVIGEPVNLSIYGDIYNLIDYTKPFGGNIGPHGIEAMFRGWTTLVKPPDFLKTHGLGTQALNSVFADCTALTSLPEFGLTLTLGTNGLVSMFANCTSLTNEDNSMELPPGTLTWLSYAGMFAGCSGLINPPRIPNATVIGQQSFYRMFYNCTSLKTLPELNITKVGAGSLANMFEGCSSLEVYSVSSEDHDTPWSLPANGNVLSGTVPSDAFRNMFLGTAGDLANVVDPGPVAGQTKTYYL